MWHLIYMNFVNSYTVKPEYKGHPWAEENLHFKTGDLWIQVQNTKILLQKGNF